MSITEKAAYLRGLMDGLKLEEGKDETKLLRALVETVSDLADEIADTQDDVDTLEKCAAMGVKFDVRKVPADSPEPFDAVIAKAKAELAAQK